MLACEAPSFAQGPAYPAPLPSSPWCAPEVEALPGDICHIDGGQRGPKRTLVVFLHGAVPLGTSDQYIQERLLLRDAQQNGFEAIFPRAPAGPRAYLWPATIAASEPLEAGFLASWRAAQATLERRAGRPFDEVFVLGFSSGAYFASSLALRGRVDYADGYAFFAGGAPYPPRPDEPPKSVPMFVGICGEDDFATKNGRALGEALRVRGLPYRVDEEPVGHFLLAVHVQHALSYLRSAVRR
jgi:predicted esterase